MSYVAALRTAVAWLRRKNALHLKRQIWEHQPTAFEVMVAVPNLQSVPQPHVRIVRAATHLCIYIIHKQKPLAGRNIPI